MFPICLDRSNLVRVPMFLRELKVVRMALCAVRSVCATNGSGPEYMGCISRDNYFSMTVLFLISLIYIFLAGKHWEARDRESYREMPPPLCFLLWEFSSERPQFHSHRALSYLCRFFNRVRSRPSQGSRKLSFCTLTHNI